MIKIVIFGSGDHAKVVFSEVVKHRKIKVLGFIDDKIKKNSVVLSYLNKKYYNLGSISETIKKKNNFKGIIGIGLNYKRKQIYKKIIYKDKSFKFEKIISKDSIVNPNVRIGDGSIIVSGSKINYGTVIGDHCIINTSSSIDHDNIFSNFSSSGPGVTTGGNVTVMECSHIGIGSIVKNGLNIKKNTIIGAGSLIIKNCKSNSIYFGYPAKMIRKRKISENYF